MSQRPDDRPTNALQPPNSIEMERNLLGAILLEGKALKRIEAIIDEGMLYKPAHVTVYRAMRDLASRGEPVDMATVADKLRNSRDFAHQGAALFLADLAESIPSAANIEFYARVIHEKWLLREIASRGRALAADALKPGQRATDSIKALSSLTGDLKRKSAIGVAYRTPKQAADAARSYIESRKSSKSYYEGITTGFASIDKITHGFIPGELIILAGRPSSGKTALAVRMGEHCASEQHPVAIISKEMAERSLRMRQISSRTGIAYSQLRNNVELYENQRRKLDDELKRMETLPMFVVDEQIDTPEQVAAAADVLVTRENIKVLIIDYLTLFDMPGDYRGGQTNWVGHVVNIFKDIARRLNITVVCLAQLSRKPDERSKEGHRPKVADLRDSGVIEQTADQIHLIWRPEMYDDLQPPKDKTKVKIRGEYRDPKGLTEYIVAKNRNGNLGYVFLKFDELTMKFYDETPYDDNYEPAPDNFYDGTAESRQADEDDELPF